MLQKISGNDDINWLIGWQMLFLMNLLKIGLHETNTKMT